MHALLDDLDLHRRAGFTHRHRPGGNRRLGLRLERRAAPVPADRRLAGVAEPDQRLRLARRWLAGIVDRMRIGHHLAELGKMAARAGRLA